jgi:hypothetical protein
MSQPWSGRRILSELTDSKVRGEILTSFWKGADEQSRRLAIIQLAKALHFREETIRKAPAGKRAEWLALRLNSPEFDDSFTLALMLFHTTTRKEMLAAFLDEWHIPHVDGAIEEEEYRTPTVEEVRASVSALRDRFDLSDIRLYLASAGLLMGESWKNATWPVVDELQKASGSAR